MTGDANHSTKKLDRDGAHAAWDIETALRRFWGEREELREIAMMFVDYTPGHLQSLRESWGRQDWDAVRHTAHRLCGAAANLSAVAFERTARQLEQAAGGDSDSLPDLIQQLNRDFDHLESLIREL